MKRKWEYIAEQCAELGYEEAEELAWEIDEKLLDIYGDKHSGAWRKLWNDKTMEGELVYRRMDGKLRAIADSTIFCIACQVESNCITCKFKKVAGHCMVDDESLFRRFIKIFEYYEAEGLGSGIGG